MLLRITSPFFKRRDHKESKKSIFKIYSRQIKRSIIQIFENGLIISYFRQTQSILTKRYNLFENPENLQKLTEKKSFIYIKKGQVNKIYCIRYLKENNLKDLNLDRINNAEQKLKEFYNFASAIDYYQILSVSYFLREIPGYFEVGQKIMQEIQKRNQNFNPRYFLC
ncbi:unnamed protein product [Paramecium sonneborni]|uniref:Uncharacterized protein n=1 Tax=Paramecium sonneborni TaxID=65129 RepID=A0A8S1LIG3_9CILI|nr:unnamed protein product [Paramecium sonneborni]